MGVGLKDNQQHLLILNLCVSGRNSCLPLGLQRQNRAARRRCREVLLHQLERLAHAHEAQVCAGDSSCEDDGARQPMS